MSSEAAKGGSTFAMVDQIEQQLRDWVSTIVPDARASFLAPGDGGPEPSIGLYLMEISPNSGEGIANTSPAAWSAPGHRRCLHPAGTVESMVGGRGLRSDGEPELGGGTAREFGDGLASPCGPCHARRSRAAATRAAGQARSARAPSAGRSEVPDGQPLAVAPGPTDEPLMGASVELPVLQQSTHTMSRGRFRFSSVPTEPSSKLLRAKGC